MANTRQAKKRARQAEAHRLHNASLRSLLRTSIKKVIKAIQSGNRTEAQSAYQAAVPIIDRMANKGIIHKNKAARHKSRLNERIRALQG
ncbi:MAG TPA: 30S ribosomal protein S20 [Gammaproteobacteria bacterium]|nr:30S ribosomal protein S20 [Gammaproteobacteria bacterium]